MPLDIDELRNWLGDTAELILSMHKDEERIDVYSRNWTDGRVQVWVVDVAPDGTCTWSESPNWEGNLDGSEEFVRLLRTDREAQGWSVANDTLG